MNTNLVKMFLLLLTLLMLPSFISGKEVDNNSQNPIVKINPEIKRQIIKSVGGNYCQANYTGDAWDLVGEATLKNFKPTHVRVALPLQFENLKYEEYKGEKILEQPAVTSLLETMKVMRNDYGVTSFTLSVWRVADELVENPGARNKRRIKADKYNEVIDMIEIFLLEAKNNYGVEVDFFSFNESNGGYMTLFSPKETICFFKMAGERFERDGLKTIFLWGDTSSTKPTIPFTSQIASDSTIWKYLGPLSFHSWWSEDIPDSEFKRIAEMAETWDRPVWCTELGFDALAHRIKGMNKTWEYALRFAHISYRVFKYAKVEVSMFWTWQNNYEIMSPDTTIKYPAYYVSRHYTDFLNNNFQLIESQSSDPEILALSGYSKEGRLIIQLVNMKKETVFVELENVDRAIVQMITTTENDLWSKKTIPSGSWKETGTVELKAESVNTLIF